jgi:hypothetical protein
MMVSFELNFHRKEKLKLFRLLAITFSPLEFIFFISMLVLFAIQFFLLSHTSSYLTPKGQGIHILDDE